MQTFLAVLDDLFRFVLTSLLGVRSFPHKEGEMLKNGMQSALPLIDEPAQSTFLPTHAPSSPVNGSSYFIGLEKVDLHTDPVVAFDVVMRQLHYGDQVRLLKLGGRWAYIRVDEHEGWVFKDALREQAKDVFPFLEEGVLYDAEHEETIKLRLVIGDAFCGGRASLLLTDAEYVTYKLHQRGLALPWESERPRTPGTWQKKLRGKDAVHISINPQPFSVMEYIVEDIGYVAFVEAVFPDGSLKLSAVGLLGEGVYGEAIMHKDQWRELRPVFIAVH
jgi:hypothetical protein